MLVVFNFMCESSDHLVCVVGADGDGGGPLGDVWWDTSNGQVGDGVRFTGGWEPAEVVCRVGGVPGSQLAVGTCWLWLVSRGERRPTHRRAVDSRRGHTAAWRCSRRTATADLQSSGQLLSLWHIWKFFLKVAFDSHFRKKTLRCVIGFIKTLSTSVAITVSPLAAASDSHRQLPIKLANISCDWLTDQNTDCCFVVIGLVHDNPTVFCSTPKKHIQVVCHLCWQVAVVRLALLQLAQHDCRSSPRIQITVCTHWVLFLAFQLCVSWHNICRLLRWLYSCCHFLKEYSKYFRIVSFFLEYNL